MNEVPAARPLVVRAGGAAVRPVARASERPLVARPKEPENKRTAPLGHGPIADPLPAELRRGDYAAVRPRPGPTVVSDDVSTVDVTGLFVEVENGTVPE